MNEFRDRGRPAGIPEELEHLPWAPPQSFLGIPQPETGFEASPIVILPVPYEATVSYMGGTRFGPRALLHASRFLETYDHELDFEPYLIGVHTLPELVLPDSGPETALHELQTACEVLSEAGKFVVMLGGEHSISGPSILVHAAKRPRQSLSVLQLDAHADLRIEYEGTPFSHACVMYRVHHEVNLVQVGIRSLTTDERTLIRRNEIPVVFGHELNRPGWMDRVLSALGDDVYITLDVDYFDPSLMPSTGTPEPGGAAWYPTLELLERVFREKNVVGCDVVELAPIPGLAAPDFLVAKLVYKLIAFHAKFGGALTTD